MNKNIEELTLLLMYLTSWEEKGYVANDDGEIEEGNVKRCWKGYSFSVINKLTDDRYLYHSKGKSVTITKEGEQLAEKLIDKYLKEE